MKEKLFALRGDVWHISTGRMLGCLPLTYCGCELQESAETFEGDEPPDERGVCQECEKEKPLPRPNPRRSRVRRQDERKRGTKNENPDT